MKMQGLKCWAQVPTSAALHRVLLKGQWGIHPCAHEATWGRHHQSDTLEGSKCSHIWIVIIGYRKLNRSSDLISYFHRQRHRSLVRSKYWTEVAEMGGVTCLPPLSPGFPSPTVSDIPTTIRDLSLIKASTKHTSLNRLRFKLLQVRIIRTNWYIPRKPWCPSIAVIQH